MKELSTREKAFMGVVTAVLIIFVFYAMTKEPPVTEYISIPDNQEKEIELARGQEHELVFGLKDFKEPTTLYLVDIWNNEDKWAFETSESIQEIKVDKKALKAKKIKIKKALNGNETRKICILCFSKEEAENIVDSDEEVTKDVGGNTIADNDFFQGIEDHNVYYSLLSSEFNQKYEAEREVRQAAEEQKRAEEQAKEDALKQKEQSSEINKLSEIDGMTQYEIKVPRYARTINISGNSEGIARFRLTTTDGQYVGSELINGGVYNAKIYARDIDASDWYYLEITYSQKIDWEISFE
ncbi:hypothetical protein JOD16_002435 [Enterococcus xiangfangensis]|nr:hypothetical protein [Enterococcus xiangfangensis]